MFCNKESNLKIKFNKKRNWKDSKIFYKQATERRRTGIILSYLKSLSWAINMKDK